jgi:hypothetical protein
VGRIGPAGLLDRDRELSAVCALLDDAASGVGGLLLVEGEAGIGKTGIVRTAGALARANGLRVLSARGSELESGLAFGLVRDMFSEPIRAADTDGHTALFVGAAALARPVLDPTVDQFSDESHDSFATLHGLYWFTAGLCSTVPTLLVVDDAHWSDLPSLRFLAYLARRLDGLKLALLVAARPRTGRAAGAAPATRLRTPGRGSPPKATRTRFGTVDGFRGARACRGSVRRRLPSCNGREPISAYRAAGRPARCRGQPPGQPSGSAGGGGSRERASGSSGPSRPASRGCLRVGLVRLRYWVTVWMLVARLGSPACRRTTSRCWWTPWRLPGSSSRVPC